MQDFEVKGVRNFLGPFIGGGIKINYWAKPCNFGYVFKILHENENFENY